MAQIEQVKWIRNKSTSEGHYDSLHYVDTKTGEKVAAIYVAPLFVNAHVFTPGNAKWCVLHTFEVDAMQSREMAVERAKHSIERAIRAGVHLASVSQLHTEDGMQLLFQANGKEELATKHRKSNRWIMRYSLHASSLEAAIEFAKFANGKGEEEAER